MKLILASASPRRKELLKYLSYPFEVRVSSVNEDIIEAEKPKDYVSRVSKEKCLSIYDIVSDELTEAFIVLSADTSVVIDDLILGKPSTKDEARVMLRKLSGRKHEVMTAYTIKSSILNEAISEIVSTEVYFRDLNELEIEDYISTTEPYDKAGGYAIQGIASKFIPHIKGSYTNVIGLPLSEVDEELKRIFQRVIKSNEK